MVDLDQVQYSIIVPTKNEEETIEAVLKDLINLTDDLIVVDGHSSDRTFEIVKELGVRAIQDNNLGKGDAIRVGLKLARNPITLFIDGDGSHDPKDIPSLIEPIAKGQADLVMGSRMLGGSEELYGSISEITRLIGSLLITLAINYRYGVRLTDYQNGFRAIRTEVGLRIGTATNRSTIEQEMAIKCLKYGYRVIEVPTREYKRKGGESKIKLHKVAHVYIWNLLYQLVTPKRKSTSISTSSSLNSKQ